MTRHTALTTLLALGTAASMPAHADVGSVFGGEIMDRNVLILEGGFPWIHAGYRVPLADFFDVEFYGRFSFTNRAGSAIMVEPGARARFRVLDNNGWQGSITADVPLQLIFNGGVDLGVGFLRPGFAATYDISRTVDLDLGIRLEDDLIFTGGGTNTLRLGVPVFVGGEVELAGIRMAAKFEGGLNYTNTATVTNTGGLFRLILGLAITL